jgi:Glycoside hydrolase family 44
LLAVDGQARTAWLPKAQLGSAPRVKISIVARGESESSEPVVLHVATSPAASERASVTFDAPSHDISPYIFGTNWGPASSVKDLGVTVRRWGGNRTTKYNWQNDVDSAGADWFFLNASGKPAGTPEEKKSYYRFIKDTLAGGAQVNFVIPISDFIAKAHPNPNSSYCSYPLSLFPNQEKTDGQGCGNGRLPNGQEIWDNDPNLGMTRNSPELQRKFVESVVKLFGPASKGGVGFYTMDNEPGLWMHTHRDALPRGISAEQLADFNLAYAKSVKAADPSAKVIGFGAWGVLELAGSNVDHLPKGPDGYKHHKETQEADRYRERKQHGGDSQLTYLLKRFKQAEAEGGARLVDVVDIHWYPELYGNTSKGERHRILDDLPYDAAFAKLQWAALREWYDPTFQASPALDSWTAGANAEYLWSPYHPVIPALKKLIAAAYPGTKLAINEYDNGSTGHYHGALLRAAALGIFMQEDLYMAQNWAQTDSSEFVYFAQKLYGNYDGRGGRVGGKFVPSRSTHADLLSYAARDGARFTVVLINKHPEKPITTTLELPVDAAEYRSYTLAESLGLRLLESRGKVLNKRVTISLPAYTALLVTAG